MIPSLSLLHSFLLYLALLHLHFASDCRVNHRLAFIVSVMTNCTVFAWFASRRFSRSSIFRVPSFEFVLSSAIFYHLPSLVILPPYLSTSISHATCIVDLFPCSTFVFYTFLLLMPHYVDFNFPEVIRSLSSMSFHRYYICPGTLVSIHSTFEIPHLAISWEFGHCFSIVQFSDLDTSFLELCKL